MFSNPFVLETQQYKRNVDPIGQYIKHAAHYLTITKGIQRGEAVEFVKKALRSKEFPNVVNPEVTYLNRLDNGDREKKTASLTDYIYSSLKAKELIAPTLTTYLNPEVKESLLLKYIDKNISRRNIAKKLMFTALANGEDERAKFEDQNQNNMKTKNNSLSGAQAAGGTPISNRTAHSTLTSNCRTTSGYGNANNEKLLAGNRHYWCVDVTINNIISIVKNTDYKALEETITKYNLYIPTYLDVVDCIKWSSDFYWKDENGHAKIFKLILKLNDYQRAAFVYSGDLYHLAKYNRSIVHDFITGLSTRVVGDFDDALTYVKKNREDVVNLARNICKEEMVGKTSDYSEIDGTQDLKTLAGTCKTINEVIYQYADFIKTFFVTENMPSSVAYIPDSIRRVALTSDTDSTIFTVYEWVNWYHEKEFVKPGDTVAAAMIFIASQAITHILAKMSANFGISHDRLHEIAMKNEYKFDVYVPTNVAKHYYATMDVKEGIILSPVKFEIKGVHLKNSNAPAVINKKAHEMMQDILLTIDRGEKISLINYLKQVGDIERDVYKSITSGETTYLRLAEIKNPESYTKPPMESPYSYHDLWLKVFAPRYGEYGEPPYSTVRISTELISPTDMKNWLESMIDKELSLRMKNWLLTNNRNKLPSIMIPSEVLKIHGIPKELLDIVNIRKIVFDITKTFYIVLETLGFYISNNKITKLISDSY